MKTSVLSFFLLMVSLLHSQSKTSAINAKVIADPLFNTLSITLESKTDSLVDLKVQIRDEKEKLVKTVNLPKGSRILKHEISIVDLNIGNYFCDILKGKNKISRTSFMKDAIDTDRLNGPPVRHEN